jgi:undecaprenyl-diphosphatase
MRACLLLLALLAPIESCDQAVRDQMQAHRAPWLEPVARVFSDIGKPQVVFGVLLAGCLIRPELGVPAARLALVTLVPTNVLTEVLKRTTFRPRPDGEHKRSNASFPSSHSANAFALAAVLSRFWRRLAPALWLGAAAVAASRVFLDRHYLSDVVVGTVIGVGSAWLAVQLFQRRGATTSAAPSAMVGAGRSVERTP